jgi:luciferase family oxidoreductase group 1
MVIPLSVLDLVPVSTGSTSGAALRNSLEFVRHLDRLGYARVWYAEHHNVPSIASTTTEVLIAEAAATTERIRVGAGGVMLPNHSPLRVAETYKMLEALHPGRIDLGIGRAPGTDKRSAMALRRSGGQYEEADFLGQLAELRGFGRNDLPPTHPFAKVRAFPLDVELPPIYLLGSGDFSAVAAAEMGLGFAFAGHFSPIPPELGMLTYRQRFKPGAFRRPHAILALSVICAESDEEAERRSSSLALTFVRMRTSRASTVPSTEEALAWPYTVDEREALRVYRDFHVCGAPSTVRARIEEVAARTKADEIMVSTIVYDPRDRLESFELLAGAFSR